jgi:hypothetical protein
MRLLLFERTRTVRGAPDDETILLEGLRSVIE